MTNQEIYDRLEVLQAQEDYGKERLASLYSNKLSNKMTAKECREEVAIRRELERISEEKEQLNNLLKENNKKKATGVLSIAGVIALSAALGFAFGKNSKTASATVEEENTKSVVVETMTNDNVESAVLPENIEVVETVPETENVSEVETVEELAEVKEAEEEISLFNDVTDENELSNAVDYIYDNEIAPMLADLKDDVFTASFTKEDLVDVIRVLNGELPIYSKYDDNTINEAIIKFTNIFANKGNGNKLYPMHFSYFFEKGSELSRYAKSYDDIYNKVAEYRSENNADGVVEMTGLLGSKVYNEWFLHGMYGGYDPYSFETEKQYFALNVAFNRFYNYVYEYLKSNDLTVCIPTCYDLDNEAFQENEVCDIMEALTDGVSVNKKVKLERGNGEIVYVFGETYMNLQDELKRKSEDVKTLRLS